MATDTQSLSSKLARRNFGCTLWVLLNLMLLQKSVEKVARDAKKGVWVDPNRVPT
jgi:hypothetical protein